MAGTIAGRGAPSCTAHKGGGVQWYKGAEAYTGAQGGKGGWRDTVKHTALFYQRGGYYELRFCQQNLALMATNRLLPGT